LIQNEAPVLMDVVKEMTALCVADAGNTSYCVVEALCGRQAPE
jgi:hypothetical protein